MKPSPASRGLEGVVDLRELTGTTGLLLVSVAVGDCLGDGFAVSNLWGTDFDFHVVRALQDVDFNVEVKLTHSLENGLAGIVVGFDAERRILPDHLADRVAEFLGIALSFGETAMEITGSGKTIGSRVAGCFRRKGCDRSERS